MNKLADSPAFPHTVSFTPDSDGLGSTAYVVQQGLTKREFFAGLAMQGLMSNGLLCAEILQHHKSLTRREAFARESVGIADALLAELAKTTS